VQCACTKGYLRVAYAAILLDTLNKVTVVFGACIREQMRCDGNSGPPVPRRARWPTPSRKRRDLAGGLRAATRARHPIGERQPDEIHPRDPTPMNRKTRFPFTDNTKRLTCTETRRQCSRPVRLRCSREALRWQNGMRRPAGRSMQTESPGRRPGNTALPPLRAEPANAAMRNLKTPPR
jgi:hypothetical protein